ncbi:short-chain dehydrogenase/reductase SDR [Streptomyces albus]|uniref:Short-chain dehydrogenase/reductase SDR n=1 Tax=Streptomyces albus (strain ATCC 21838 / DSM 41398 / FERM P-419 / JCM 4703 / NBRC 107858) TaxID=1081613 RepID=A0A0B5EQG0_STRA4|nr:short-chain dehydrogenase/reductase SDR [Streptomyces albus]AOU74717.1 short-chain dehydrogenase/reductase SDR [Streptomyces albus]AYN30528.1 short-chain dehydrogenase/reductase SDR [Streptomyces albus]
MLVTGGAQGIGAKLARELAARGAKVAVGDLTDPAPVVKEIEETGQRAYGQVVDVGDGAAVTEFVRAVGATLGPVDVLVNNAGIFTSLTHKPFTEITSDEFDRVLAINVRGVFECAKAVVPDMKATGRGSIVNISSTVFHGGTPGLLHYVASKSAVIGMTRAMARELGDEGIRVNSVAPGLVASQGVRDNEEHSGLQAAVLAKRSLKREQLPEDLVGPVLFLAGDDSQFVTGQTLIVDGGAFME